MCKKKPSLMIIQGGGCAQIEHATGIAKALEEEGIIADLYRGASSGALWSSLYVSGLRAAKMEELIRTMKASDLFKPDLVELAKSFIPFLKCNYFFDYSNVEKIIKQYIDDKEAFAKVKVSITNVATNKDRVVPATVDTIMASMALPEIFPYRKIGNNYYKDGGVVNNIPLVKRTQLFDYSKIYIILCNAVDYKKPAWYSPKVYKLLNEAFCTMDREANDVHEMFDDDPHVLIFQAPCFKSSLLDFSEGYALIDHAYEYGKQRILELKQKGYLLS